MFSFHLGKGFATDRAIHIEDKETAQCAGRHAEIQIWHLAPELIDALNVESCIVEAARAADRLLPARLARQDWPPLSDIPPRGTVIFRLWKLHYFTHRISPSSARIISDAGRAFTAL